MKRLCALALSSLFVSCLVASNRRGSRRWRQDSRPCTKQLRKRGKDFSRGGQPLTAGAGLCRSRKVCGGGASVYVGAEDFPNRAWRISHRYRRHAQQPGGPRLHVRPVCPGGALADARSGHQQETPGLRLSRRGVECRESVPASRGPGQPEKAEPLYRRALAIRKRARWAVPSRGPEDAGKTLPMPCEN
jgi:hypothetical protein